MERIKEEANARIKLEFSRKEFGGDGVFSLTVVTLGTARLRWSGLWRSVMVALRLPRHVRRPCRSAVIDFSDTQLRVRAIRRRLRVLRSGLKWWHQWNESGACVSSLYGHYNELTLSRLHLLSLDGCTSILV